MRVTGIPYVQGRNSYTDRDGQKYGIAIHNTSNDASDTAEASYATRRTDGVSSHLYADRDSVTQSLDTAARAGHAGSNTGNENAIAVEITGANGWSRQTWLNSVAWDQLGAALAQIVRAYGIQVRRASVAEMQANPKVKAFYSHDDMRRAWGGTDHTDPGPGFPWDRLFQAVNAALSGGSAAAGADMDSEQNRRLVNIDELTYQAIGTGADNVIGTTINGVNQARPVWMTRELKTQTKLLEAIAAKVDIDAAELAAIQEAARAGVAAATEGLIERIVTAVGNVSSTSPEEIEAVVREVFADAGQA